MISAPSALRVPTARGRGIGPTFAGVRAERQPHRTGGNGVTPRGLPSDGVGVAWEDHMLLEAVLGRCRAFEARAAAVYRAFAERTGDDAAWSALWTELAREEEAHGAALTRASRWLDRTNGWHTSLSGWDEALDEIEARLAEAESPDIGANHDRQLLAALALERSELDPIYHRLTALTHAAGDTAPDRHAHVEPLVAAAERSTVPAVRLEAALLRARMLLEHG